MTTTPLVLPQSLKIAEPANGNLVAVYQHLLTQMAAKINDLEARIVALGG